LQYRRRFTASFGDGGEVRFARAPGRVNLIGEHTDYNDGFVLPMAIEPNVTLAYRVREDDVIRIVSDAMPGRGDEFRLSQPIDRAHDSWTRYPRGVAAMLRQDGVALRGIDAMYFHSLPVGGGLSSSAAIEISTAVALLDAAGVSMTPVNVAKLCQQEYAGVPCGIMDQMIVAGAKPGCAMLLDCRDLTARHVAIDQAQVSVVILNTMVRHELSGSEYGDRRRRCETGVAEIAKVFPQVRSLRDATQSMLVDRRVQLDDLTLRRCRHVVGEIGRSQRAADCLERGEYEEVGRLMKASHESLRTDYEVSCVELDELAGRLNECEGVYGARMTGAGFGGCVVALVTPGSVGEAIKSVARGYRQQFGIDPQAIVTVAVGAAGRVDDQQI
jgi:galactokinase